MANTANTLVNTAAQAALKVIGPVFAAELKKTPDDAEAAWNRAVEIARDNGSFSAPGWSLFPARFFTDYVKPLALQNAGPRWIDHPGFWSKFVTMIANSDGPDDAAKLIRSMCDASGIPPQRVVAKLKTYFCCNAPGLH